MKMVQVHWFGSLGPALSQLEPPPVGLALSRPTPLTEVLDRLGIPEHLVQLVMVNHRAVARDAFVRPSDRIALFPREYPFFVDWKDFRRS